MPAYVIAWKLRRAAGPTAMLITPDAPPAA
jgi:hypothetical protein